MVGDGFSAPGLSGGARALFVSTQAAPEGCKPGPQPRAQVAATPKGGDIKTRPSFTSAPERRHLSTDPYSGACKINARRASRARRTCCGQQGIGLRQDKFCAAPPTPRGYNAERNGVDPSLQNKRSFLSGAARTLVSALYNGGLGGARETYAGEKEISGARAEIVWMKDATSVYFASTGKSQN